jgi:hypothetical protein
MESMYKSPASANPKGLVNHLLIRFRLQARTEAIMSFKDAAVNKYVVRLSLEECEYLDQLIRKGKTAALRLMKARILQMLPHPSFCQAWLSQRAKDSLPPVRPPARTAARLLALHRRLGVDRTEHHGVADFAAPDLQPTPQGAQKPVGKDARFSAPARFCGSPRVSIGGSVLVSAAAPRFKHSL